MSRRTDISISVLNHLIANDADQRMTNLYLSKSS